MQLIGLARIGRDVEVRHTGNGKPVANISLAYNCGKDVTQWIEAALFGDRAEKLAPYLTKGKLICVTLDGPRVETYQKKDRTQGTKMTAIVSQLEFAGSKQAQDDSGHADRPKPSQPPAQASLPGNVQDMDDDIPF